MTKERRLAWIILLGVILVFWALSIVHGFVNAYVMGNYGSSGNEVAYKCLIYSELVAYVVITTHTIIEIIKDVKKDKNVQIEININNERQ